MSAIGVVGLVLVAFTLEETRPPAERAQSDVASTLRAFALLLRDARFMGLTAIGAFGMVAAMGVFVDGTARRGRRWPASRLSR